MAEKPHGGHNIILSEAFLNDLQKTFEDNTFQSVWSVARERDWPWALWPPSSPDCNPLDYGIWGIMNTNIGATPYPNITALKASIVKEW